MLQLENQTPFKASIALLPDPTGIDTLFVIVKATLALRPNLKLAEEQGSVTLADEYHGDPALSSLRVASEMHLAKAGTDVLLVGSAHAPNGEATSMTVGMAVADRKQTILVTGDRVWREGKPSAPRPFASIPLIWERAFGGWHRQGDKVVAEERNPAGCGFVGGRSAKEMEGKPLPNLEDPTTAIRELGQAGTPRCFAPIAASWLPRRSFAGTYDARWQRSRAPYLPDDFNPRFFQTAADFAFDRYLSPGERVHAVGVSPDGPIVLSIPDARLSLEVVVAGATERPTPNLETLLIEPDENRASLTWRAAVPCDRKALKVEKIVVGRSPGGPRS